MGIDIVLQMFHDILTLPAEVEYLPDTGVDGTVAHNEDHVAGL